MKKKPWRAPIFVFADLPESDEERSQLLMEILDGKPDIERRPTYWSSYVEKIDQVMARAEDFKDFRPKTAAARQKIDAARKRHTNADQLVYLPIIANALVYSVLIDPATKEPVDFIGVNPWEQSAVPAAEPQT